MTITTLKATALSSGKNTSETQNTVKIVMFTLFAHLPLLPWQLQLVTDAFKILRPRASSQVIDEHIIYKHGLKFKVLATKLC